MKKLQFSEAQLKYLELCEEEFRERTGIKFRRDDGQGRPILDFSFSKDGLTYDRLFQAIVLSKLTEPNYFLLDLYYNDPTHLAEISRTIAHMAKYSPRMGFHAFAYSQQSMNEDISRAVRELPDEFRSVSMLPQYRRFIELCLPLKPADEDRFQRLILETSAGVTKRLKESRAFEEYMKFEQAQYVKDNTANLPPFLAGLSYILLDEVNHFEANLKRYIAKYWQSPELGQLTVSANSQPHSDRLFQNPARHVAFAPSGSGKTTCMESDITVVFEPSGSGKTICKVPDIHVVFAPSGSGKTTCIMDKLTREWGYYIVSSALRRDEGTRKNSLDSNILDPKIYPSVSRDSAELLKILKNCGDEGSDKYMVVQAGWKNILEARNRVFHAFLEAETIREVKEKKLDKFPDTLLDNYTKEPLEESLGVLPNKVAEKLTPRTWLSFQLDCDRWDPFLQLFRVLSLFPLSTDGFNPVSAAYRGIAKYGITQFRLRWICIDEAQEDLRYQVGGNNVLALAMHLIINGATPAGVIFAGTSLNISGALKSLDWVTRLTPPALQALRRIDRRQEPYQIVREFPLVTSESDAKKTLRVCGLSSERILDEAAKHCMPLWGRVKWTSMYAERIAQKMKQLRFSESGNISDEEYARLDLRSLAGETFEDVVGHLVRRLELIQQRGDGSGLLNILLEAAISADIRGLPHVFHRNEDLELVDQGFALVTTSVEGVQNELAKYFETISRDTFQLTLALRGELHVEEGIVYLLGKVRQLSLPIPDCTIDKLTSDLAQEGFTIVDCIPFGLKNDEQKAGYAKATKWRETLTQKHLQDFDIVKDGEKYVLSAKLKPGATIKPHLIEELSKDKYIITRGAISKLIKLVRDGFTIRNPTLAATLKERVAIDAIIRFFESKLVEKLIGSLMGVSTRTGLGHPAEYFLAVQLRQFFTSPPLTEKQPNEWQRRRENVLTSLSEAQNEMAKIQGLSEATLILGDQTVKRSGDWESWVFQLLEWLNAIEQGHKSCASFLLPHNDFGPDLVFALRRKDGSVVLCSVQLKLGGGNLDAINKSSISWACVGKALEIEEQQRKMQAKLKTDQVELQEVQKALNKLPDIKAQMNDNSELASALETAKMQLQKAKTQLKKSKSDKNPEEDAALLHSLRRLEGQLKNSFWKGQDKLSLLIAAGDQIPDELKKGRPATGCDETYEFYGLINGAVIPDLFGTEFLGVLKALKD